MSLRRAAVGMIRRHAPQVALLTFLGLLTDPEKDDALADGGASSRRRSLSPSHGQSSGVGVGAGGEWSRQPSGLIEMLSGVLSGQEVCASPSTSGGGSAEPLSASTCLFFDGSPAQKGRKMGSGWARHGTALDRHSMALAR
jgi:hypothetical protein